MTTAVLIAGAASSDGCTALLRAGDRTLLDRLARQLREAGARDVLALTTPAFAAECKQAAAVDVEQVADPADALDALAAILARVQGPVLLVQADVLTHRGALESLLKDPRIGSGVLVHAGEGGWPARVERGRITGASSPYHRTSGARMRSLGLLLIARAHTGAAARVAAELAALARALPPAMRDELARRAQHLPVEQVAAAPWDVVAMMTAGLVRADVPLRCAYLRKLFWARPLTSQQAAAAMASLEQVDEEKVLMDSSVKAADGFFGTFFCSPYTKYIARALAKLGVRPNQVTVFSFGLGVASALAFARGTDAALLVGAVLLYLTLAFDCVDGQLARYSKRYTSLGAWLDPMFDRAKEYGVIGALAIGAVATGADRSWTWLLAGAALTMQTVRHFMDFSYAASRQRVQARARIAPLDVVADDRAARPEDEVVATGGDADEFSEGHDAPPAGASVRAKVIGRSAALNRVPAIVWVKRIIQFPIGERYAAISLAAALSGARAVFVVLLAWGTVAMAYSTAGRLMRSAL